MRRRFRLEVSTRASMTDMQRIVEWLRPMGIDPAMVPTDAEMTVDLDALLLTVEIYSLNDGGKKWVDPTNGRPARSTITVELEGAVPRLPSVREIA